MCAERHTVEEAGRHGAGRQADRRPQTVSVNKGETEVHDGNFPKEERLRD